MSHLVDHVCDNLSLIPLRGLHGIDESAARGLLRRDGRERENLGANESDYLTVTEARPSANSGGESGRPKALAEFVHKDIDLLRVCSFKR